MWEEITVGKICWMFGTHYHIYLPTVWQPKVAVLLLPLLARMSDNTLSVHLSRYYIVWLRKIFIGWILSLWYVCPFAIYEMLAPTLSHMNVHCYQLSWLFVKPSTKINLGQISFIHFCPMVNIANISSIFGILRHWFHCSQSPVNHHW